VLFEGKALVERSVPVQVWRRGLAWATDVLMSVVITLALTRWCLQLAAPAGKVAHLADLPGGWYAPILIGGWVLYRGITEASGASVGKWIFRVRAYRPQGKLGVLPAMLRAITAPLDTVFGHLEHEGPIDKKLNVKIEPERRRPGRAMRVNHVVCIVLAMICAASLVTTSTAQLVKELGWLERNGKCGQVPREVLRFTDRSERLHSNFLERCDHVMDELVSRAAGGDEKASAAMASLPYASDWGYQGGGRPMTAATDHP
jgi:hypothetical protein